MDNKNGNEMEQIQRGLEAFLERELDGFGGVGSGEGGYSGNTPPDVRERRLAAPEEIQVIGQGKDGIRQQGDREDVYGSAASEDFGDWDREVPVRKETYVREPECDWDREEFGGKNSGRKMRSGEGRSSGREPDRESRSGRREPDREGRSSGRESDRESRSPGRETGREEQSGKRGANRTERARKEDSGMAEKTQKSRKKKRKKKHRLLKFFLTAAVIVALLGVGLYQLVGVVYGKLTYKDIASVAGAPLQEEGVVNILLIGNDSRENGEDGRSDAMILLSVSKRTKTIYMTSLLRDMYVDIPGHEGNRLNAAYSFGGAELLMETIEKNFGISVNRYVLVNFEAFAGLVDAVDGIELELSSEEIEYVNGYLVEYNMLTNRPQGTDNMDTSVSGLVHLNGPQALAYSRNRYLGTDFGRTDRQRKVLTAVIKKLPSALLTNAGGLLEGLMPNLTTNLTQNECFRLSLMAGRMLTYEIVSDSIPQPGTYRDVTIRKMSVLEVDFETNIRYLREKLYGEHGAD